MNNQNRLEFYYTDLEWTIAEQKAKKSGSKSIPHYLTKKISELDKDLSLCKTESLRIKIKSKRRKYYPPNTSWAILEKLSESMGISASILVSRLLINPLLNHSEEI